MKLILYLFWNAVYLFRRRPTDLTAFLLMVERTVWPWRKFTPYIYRCEDSHAWEIHLAGDATYMETRYLLIDCYVSLDTGDVVGFRIGDHVLRKESQ